MHVRRLAAVGAVLLLALGAGACQGNSPLSPSGEDVVLRGTVFSGAASGGVSAASGSHTTSAASITVSLASNPAVTATVAADGSFTLRGLPPGDFTLVFSADGREIGRLAFGAVLPNQEITIVVDVAGNIVTLLDERRTGIGNGEIEIEGLVSQVLVVNANADSTFRVSGYTVVVRAGQTAVREGNTARTVLDITAGRRVHVKGTWLTSAGTADTGQVLAQEVLLQGDGASSVPPGGGSGPACMINGGRVGDGIELEGHVADGGGGAFRLQVNGNRAAQPVQVDAGGAVFQCHPSGGPNAVPAGQCPAQVKGGTKVHVSGTLSSCGAQEALVRASKVIVQK
jgi:hypothetical protein